MNAADIVEATRGAICLLQVMGTASQQQIGTGISIEPDGHVVTCYHVVHPGWTVKQIRATFPDGSTAVVQRTAWEDGALDLARLELDKPIALRLKKEPHRNSDRVMKYSYLGTQSACGRFQ